MFSRCYIVVNDCADNGLTPHNEEIKVMIKTQSASLKKRQLWVSEMELLAKMDPHAGLSLSSPASLPSAKLLD